MVYMSRQLIGKRLDKIVAMINLQSMVTGYNNSFHIGVNKLPGDREFFSENVQGSVGADEAYKYHAARGNSAERRDLGIGSQHQGFEVMIGYGLVRRLPIQTAVPVMPVVKTLEMFCLLLQGCVTHEELPAKELSVIRVVESFHYPVAPGFANRDEYRSDAVVQTDAQYNPQGPRIAVAAPEAKFVVDLKKQGDAHRLPAPHKACCHVMIFLCSLGLDIDAMAKHINDVERIEPSIVLDIPGTNEIHLVHMVDSCHVPEIGIFNSFRNVGSFF